MTRKNKHADEHYDRAPKAVGDVYCPKCGGPFSSKTQFCVHCGKLNEESGHGKLSPFMKALMLTVVISAAAVLLYVLLKYGESFSVLSHL